MTAHIGFAPTAVVADGGHWEGGALDVWVPDDAPVIPTGDDVEDEYVDVTYEHPGVHEDSDFWLPLRVAIANRFEAGSLSIDEAIEFTRKAEVS